jgi:site-specific recombinase XerD
MTALPVIQNQHSALTIRPDELETAKGYLACQLSPATKSAYLSDGRTFVAWCNERGYSPLPASPEVVATFLSESAREGRKYATISRRAAAINFAHVAAGFDSPTRSHIVCGMLQGIRRTVGVAPVKKAPATAAKVREMVRLCPDTLAGKRDRAVLLLGFAGAFRRSELVALTVADVVEESAGLRVTIRHSKTDQEGRGQTVAIARGEVHCPVAALLEYLKASGITEGPIFRSATRWGSLRASPLNTAAVATIVKHYAELAGFDPAEFAGHSLRSGFLTSAAENGANIFKMMDISRHRSVDTVRGYVRHADAFKNHAGAGLL